MSAFSRVLVPIDFGTESKAVLRIATSLARALGASLYLVHVVRDPYLAVDLPELYAVDWAKLRADLVAETTSRLEALAAEITHPHVTCDVWVGSAPETIIQAAIDGRADLIVMGTHGRGAMGQLFIGSVADRVIRHAPCPVVTVGPFGAVHVAPQAAAGDVRAGVGAS
jgi:universal stress protein A